MPSQGPFLVGSGANIAGPNSDWLTPGNITADDGANATSSTSIFNPQLTDYLAGTNCGFTIPDGETIAGIEVGLNDLAEPGDSGSLEVTKNGSTTVGLSKVAVAQVGWLVYGSPTDLWETIWTPAEIRATTFGAMLLCGDATFNTSPAVDAFRLTVYTAGPPPAGPPVNPAYQDFPRFLRSIRRTV